MSDQVFVLSSDSIDYYVIYNKDFSAVHAYSLSAPDSDLLVSICTAPMPIYAIYQKSFARR